MSFSDTKVVWRPAMPMIDFPSKWRGRRKWHLSVWVLALYVAAIAATAAHPPRHEIDAADACAVCRLAMAQAHLGVAPPAMPAPAVAAAPLPPPCFACASPPPPAASSRGPPRPRVG